MNQNNILNNFPLLNITNFEFDSWLIQKIDPWRYEKVFNAYRFYKKFNLENLGFIKAKLTNQNSELFLKVKKHVKTYPNEWTVSMIKDATLFHLNLFEQLYHLNLSLKSSSLQNIFFEGTSPVFLDLTTLTMRDEETHLPLILNDSNLKNIVNKIFLVIELIKYGNYLEIRQILQEKNDFILNKKAAAMLAKNKVLKGNLEESIKIHTTQLSSKKNFVDQCQYLYNLVLHTDALPAKTNNKLNDNKTHSNNNSNLNLKQKSIQQILQAERPINVLDINTDSGWSSFLAESQGANVIATGTDESSIDNLYNQAKKQNLRILPLFMPFSSMTSNIACDLVLCLENLDEITSKENLNLNTIFKIFGTATKKTAVIEFSNTASENIDIIINYGLQYFKTVEIIDSYTNENKLLMFKK